MLIFKHLHIDYHVCVSLCVNFQIVHRTLAAMLGSLAALAALAVIGDVSDVLPFLFQRAVK